MISLISRNRILAAAAGFVLILNLLRLEQYYPLLERRGIEAGLLFLSIAVLVPFAADQVSPNNLIKTAASPIGLFAVIEGLIGSYLNAQGIDLIQLKPEIVPGILIGIIISVAFLVEFLSDQSWLPELQLYCYPFSPLIPRRLLQTQQAAHSYCPIRDLSHRLPCRSGTPIAASTWDGC